jgi:hypothetical protein
MSTAPQNFEAEHELRAATIGEAIEQFDEALEALIEDPSFLPLFFYELVDIEQKLGRLLRDQQSQ